MISRSHLPAFPSFVGTYIYNVGTDMVVRELLLGILGIGEYLRHVLGTGIAERQHAFRLLRLEILEFHQPVILVIVRTGDTGHLEIRTARRIVLLDGERIVAAQVTGTKLEEGATDEILVDLVEHLRRDGNDSRRSCSRSVAKVPQKSPAPCRICQRHNEDKYSLPHT